MMRIAKILVPTDFSPSSEGAAQHAAELAKVFSALVVVLHVMESDFDYKGYGLDADAIPVIQEELQAAIEGQLAQVGGTFPESVSTSLHVRRGAAWHEIVEAAREHAADLVVMGTHGHTGLEHVLLGSTAEKVVRSAPCPVLTVRAVKGET